MASKMRAVMSTTRAIRCYTAEPVGDDCDIGMGSQPDRRFIAVGCRGLPTRVWDTAHDRLLAELPSATPIDAKDFISAAPAVSAAGDLAAVARDTAVNVYSLPGGRLLRTLDNLHNPRSGIRHRFLA